MKSCPICLESFSTGSSTSLCRDCWKIVNLTKMDIPKLLRLLAWTIEEKETRENK